MNNDDLRDDAKILALTATVRALLGHIREREGGELGVLGATVDDLILDGDVGDEAMKRAAVAYRREALFKPPY